MKMPAAIMTGIAAMKVLWTIPTGIGLILASLTGDSARVAEISAGMIEDAVYGAVAASVGLAPLGVVGVVIVKAISNR